MSNITNHFRNDRADRATYIAQTVGFGEIVAERQVIDAQGRFAIHKLTETGVLFIYNRDGVLVTMFIATMAQVKRMYNYKHIPNWLATKVMKNTKKGYIANQPQ